MADDQIGWEIQGTFYPHVGFDGLLHGDHALMREVTGLTLSEIDSGEDPEAIETAWMAVAVWHQNLDMRRGDVRKFVERLPRNAAKPVGFGDAAPLDGSVSADSGRQSSGSESTPADDSSRSASPSTTKSQEDSTLDQSVLSVSGSPPSDIGVTSPPPISVPSTSAAA